MFCAIAAGEAPANIVDQDADTVAFMDINPWQRGHALVIPRRHYENLLEIDPDALAKTLAMARRLAAQMTERLGAEGVVLWNSYGESAGRSSCTSTSTSSPPKVSCHRSRAPRTWPTKRRSPPRPPHSAARASGRAR
jgi:diadenosine tetraphosphate (Ap4A) HIT family hydrolase